MTTETETIEAPQTEVVAEVVERARNLPAKAERTMRASSIAVTSAGISFQNAGEVLAFANMMAKSETAIPAHLRGRPGDCLGIIDDAIRFGMSPYALARKSYFVNNNLAYEAQAVSAMLMAKLPMKKRPKYEWEGEGAEMFCRVTIFPADEEEPVVHESPRIKDIKTKNSPLWVSDPKVQLGYYTIRAAARLHFPDVLLGVYDREEMLLELRAVNTPRGDGEEIEGEAEPRQSIGTRLAGAVVDTSHLERGRLAENMSEGDEVVEETTTVKAEVSDELPLGDPKKDAPASPWNEAETKLLAEITVAVAACKTNAELGEVIRDYAPQLQASIQSGAITVNFVDATAALYKDADRKLKPKGKKTAL